MEIHEAPPDGSFRTMSFNVRGCSHADGSNVWAQRRALNVTTIKRAAPHLIGFQEIERDNLATYREELPGYDFVLSPPQALHEPSEHVAIFWQRSRFTLLATDGFWLGRDPSRCAKDWGARCVRAAVWAKLRCRKTGVELLHMNTHLDHISEQARVEGSRLILNNLVAMEINRLPTIVTGDFNCSPWTPDGHGSEPAPYTDETYRLFLAAGFRDSYLDAGNVDSMRSNTYHGFEGTQYTPERHRLGWRLDWILIRDGARRLETQHCTIIRDEAPPLYPSDHYPVVADLLITGRRPLPVSGM